MCGRSQGTAHGLSPLPGARLVVLKALTNMRCSDGRGPVGGLAAQLMKDAIAFRFGRLERPCLDCTSRLRCDEHAFDQHLLEMYKASACSPGITGSCCATTPPRPNPQA